MTRSLDLRTKRVQSGGKIYWVINVEWEQGINVESGGASWLLTVSENGDNFVKSP